jgi:hypothetical protein
VDPLDGPAGAVGLQQAGAHAGRDAGGGGDPRLVLPLQHRHGHRGADRAADGRRVQTTLEEHRVAQLLLVAGHRAARFKIGRHVLFEESDVRAWIKAHGIPAEPAAGRRKDADRGTGW